MHSIHPLNNFLNKWTVGKLGKLLRKFVTFYIGLLNGSFLQLFWRKIVLIYTASKRIGSKSRTCCIARNQKGFSQGFIKTLSIPCASQTLVWRRPFMPFSQVETSMVNDVQPKHGSGAKSVKVSVDLSNYYSDRPSFMPPNFLVLHHHEVAHLLGR